MAALAKAKRLQSLNAFTVLREEAILEEASIADVRIKVSISFNS